jgi:hypothetical protein
MLPGVVVSAQAIEVMRPSMNRVRIIVFTGALLPDCEVGVYQMVNI